MQVKKFEAKTMKEALEMVKSTLGPEAIILSARDHRGGFGLAGQKSVEVTAAVSEEMLRKKALAERRLNEINRGKYLQASAGRQREFIEKVFNQHSQEMERKMRPMTSTPYIDIGDEAAKPEELQTPALAEPLSTESAEQRIKGAAQRAFSGAMELFSEPPQRQANKEVSSSHDTGEILREDSGELLALRREIKHLKSVISKFNKVPQNFVTMHPGAEEGIPYELSFIYQKLCRSGINRSNVVSILRKAQECLPKDQLKRKGFVDAWVAKYILDHTRIAENRTLSKYHVFLGPCGHGKTTSLVKLASHMVVCEKKRVAIVTTDTRRVGSAEQLRIYSQILNVPFAIIRKSEDWLILEKKLAHIDAILVDFPGLNLRSMAEIDFVRNMLPKNEDDCSVHFVQSILARDDDAIEIASRYKAVGFDDVIFTNLDETTHHGLIFNFQEKFETPLHSFSIGSHIPEDFEPATKERVVDLIFKLTKLKKKEAYHE